MPPSRETAPTPPRAGRPPRAKRVGPGRVRNSVAGFLYPGTRPPSRYNHLQRSRAASSTTCAHSMPCRAGTVTQKFFGRVEFGIESPLRAGDRLGQVPFPKNIGGPASTATAGHPFDIALQLAQFFALARWQTASTPRVISTATSYALTASESWIAGACLPGASRRVIHPSYLPSPSA